MQGTRDQLLAGARFAGDHHRGGRLRQAADGAKYILHCWRLAENFRCGRGSFDGFGLALAFLQCAANQQHRLVDVKGFGQVFEGAPLES